MLDGIDLNSDTDGLVYNRKKYKLKFISNENRYKNASSASIVHNSAWSTGECREGKVKTLREAIPSRDGVVLLAYSRE